MFRFVACQALVRFFMLHQIKPHAPLLVRAPVNSFEFHSCKCTGRSYTPFSTSYYHRPLDLQGILFATYNT
jgi:hypothetical protein